MKHSEKRILNTHAGSLPRPDELSEMLGNKSRHEPLDERALEQMIADSTRGAVARQLEAGIDVGDNGERGRESFFTYVQHRMSGFSGHSARPVMSDLALSEFRRAQGVRFRTAQGRSHARAQGHRRSPLRSAAVKKECADFRRAPSKQRAGFADAFITAPSPGIIAAAMLNEHYPSMAEYIDATARDKVGLTRGQTVYHGCDCAVRIDLRDLTFFETKIKF